jgi:hypothetical protein
MVTQILALNADNATSNDTQTSALAQMENTFEEANRVRCFNHTLQLSAKTLLKPFNMGMSSTNANTVMEEEESNNFGDEMLTLFDNQATDDNEGSGGENGDGSVEDLGSDEDPADIDEVDELNQLDEQQREELLRDTAVVRHTVTKVSFDQFSFCVVTHFSLIAGPAIIVRNHSLNNHRAPSLAFNLCSTWVQGVSNPSRCCHAVELDI